MEQKIAKVGRSAPLQQLREQVQNFRTDAQVVLNAIKHDYEQVRKTMQNLQARSELKAFVQGHLKRTTAVRSVAAGKPAVRKTVRARKTK